LRTEGEGDLITDGDTVYMHYRGQLENGETFDFSRNNQRHADFNKYKQEDMPAVKVVMGDNEFVPGYIQALKMMNKGAVADVIIPPSLGYAVKALKTIPAYSYLMFNIEIIDVVKPGEHDAIKEQMMKAFEAEMEAKRKAEELQAIRDLEE